MGVLMKQGGGGHDLSSLAVTTLGYVVLDPNLLKWVTAVFGEALNSGDALLADLRNWELTALLFSAIYQDRACSACADAAAIFRSRQFELIAQNPEEGHVWSYIDCVLCTVYLDLK